MGRLEQLMTSYLFKTFLNYDRGLIQKKVQEAFDVTYAQLAEMFYNFIFDIDTDFKCA